MTNPFGPETDFLARVRAIADALLPVLRAFRAELGAERANAIAARGLAEWRRGLAEATAERVVGAPRDCWEKVTVETLDTVEGTIDVANLSEGRDALRFAVTGCRLAEYFRAIGEPELGFELGCAHDLDHVEALGRGAVVLERAGTLMQGARSCDFLYRFASSGPSK